MGRVTGVEGCRINFVGGNLNVGEFFKFGFIYLRLVGGGTY